MKDSLKGVFSGLIRKVNLRAARGKSMGEAGLLLPVPSDGFPVLPRGPEEPSVPVRMADPGRMALQCRHGDGTRCSQDEQGGQDVVHSGLPYLLNSYGRTVPGRLRIDLFYLTRSPGGVRADGRVILWEIDGVACRHALYNGD